MRLIVEELGPLRDTSLELGDVTILFGLPNTGKSYLLRALYSKLLHLDPQAIRFCIDALRYSEELDDALDVEVEGLEASGRGTRAKRVRVELDAGKLATAVNSIVTSCFERALLPRGSRYKLEADTDTLDSLLDPSRLSAPVAEAICAIVGGGGAVSAERCMRKVDESRIIVEFEGVETSKTSKGPEHPASLELIAEIAAALSTSVKMRALQEAFVKEASRGTVDAKKLVSLVEILVGVRRVIVEAVESVLTGFAERAGYRLVYAVYGRSLVTQVMLHTLLRPEEREYSIVAEALGLRSLPALSLLTAATQGYRLIVEDPKLGEKLERVFGVLLGGWVRVAPGAIGYTVDGVTVPLHFASALVGEMVGLMLATAPLLVAHRGILLVEEPEAQLHPRLHTLLPVVLYALAAQGVQVVTTTHSDILVSVAAALARLSREARKDEGRLREAVSQLIERFATRMPPRDTLDSIASLIAERLPEMRVKFYHVGGGKVEELQPDEVLSHIPSMTEVHQELTRWYLGV